jgi:hypothetical protein
LLTALLRARNIPAQLAIGFRYVPSLDAFVGHAWVAAYIEGDWKHFDASHIAGGIDATYLQVDELPDFLLPLKGWPPNWNALEAAEIDRIEVLEQRWVRSASDELAGAKDPSEVGVAEPAERAPRVTHGDANRTAFSLGCLLGDAALLRESGRADDPNQQRAWSRLEFWSSELGVPLLLPDPPQQDAGMAPINAERYVRYRVMPHLSAELRSVHSNKPRRVSV